MALSPVTPRDLFLARELSEEAAQQYLAARGFRDPTAADQHLQQLADDLQMRLALGALADRLLETLVEAPDPDAALVGFCRYVATRRPKGSFIRYLLDDPRALQILTHLLGASPFLGEILIRNPEYLHWLQSELDRPAPDLIDYREELESILRHDVQAKRRLDALKRFQRREILRIGGRDLLDRETLHSATEQLSNLADIITEGVLRTVLDEPLQAGTGALLGTFVVIGMGKLGGRELNYSSDIDLIYVYDPTDPEDSAVHDRFQKLGRRLTEVLGEHTDEGYFYRVDLRLRPMGKRGNVAYSLRQSEQYYESLGETFERFALIKARPIAGDLALGARFIDMVRPFVYRKYLDHAAMEELARYKARSDREQRREATANDVKVGRGGIREIELFTQVFQLIYGGTHRDLQDANTLSALPRLVAHGFIDETVLGNLQRAYEFLRTVEHRLQIVQEAQTHTLSEATDELEITARRTEFETVGELRTALDGHRQRVHAVYANLLERRSDDADYRGRQLFRLLSGELSDGDAADHLRSHGLSDPDGALRTIRALDDAPSLAHSKSATRNLLANLLAVTLSDVADSGSPGKVLNRLERVVTHCGAPAALYRSLLENDELRAHLLLALDTGDLFAQRLGRYPELLDILVTRSLDATDFLEALRLGLDQIGDGNLDTCRDPFRRFKAIEEFKVLVEWLPGGTLETLNRKLSLVADCSLQWVAHRAERERLVPPNGGGPEDRWVLLALGKLGGRELTVHSDLDLVFLYEGDRGDARRFERQQAFVRNIYSFLETPTSEGVAYKVDTRLRPEGKKGALAIPVVAFGRYLESRAEIWERMAWTRYRFVAGAPDVGDQVEQAVRTFVYGPWDPVIPGYARHVRGRMERELANEADGRRRNLKVGRGGLADIDFLLQVIQLREGAEREGFREPGTRQLLTNLPATAYLSGEQVGHLRDAYEFLRTLETVLRIESDSGIGWISTDAKELEPLVRHFDVVPARGEALLERYREVTDEVRAIYDEGMKRLEA